MALQKDLLKNLIIGFLPLLIFIVADELFGLMIGLIVAVVFGVLEALVIFIRERRLDRFILFDVGLIVALGLVSILLENDIFFKLKPALIEAILAGLLGVTAFSNYPLLLKMSGRYMKGITFSDEQTTQMQQLVKIFFWIIIVHIGLILYAAFYLDNAAWAFISGGLLYILLGVMMAGLLGKAFWTRHRNKKALASEEWFDLVTPEGQVVGKAPRSQVHGNPALLHPVVHLHIINSDGDIFLQKRSAAKDLLPGYWDTAVGGHVASGESIEAALVREADEELGLKNFQAQPLFRYIMQNSYESELVNGFLLLNDGPFAPNTAEIEEARFWTIAEIRDAIGKNLLTPNFENEFQILLKILSGQKSSTHPDKSSQKSRSLPPKNKPKKSKPAKTRSKKRKRR